MGSEQSQWEGTPVPTDTLFCLPTRRERQLTVEPPELEEQLCDNPSRELLNGTFLHTAVTASHDILQLAARPPTPSKPTARQISLFRVSSEGLGSKSSAEDAKEEDLEYGHGGSGSARRASIECLLSLQESQESLELDPSLIQPISDYILSEQNLFSPATIAKESFVRFRSENVRLSYSFGEKLGEGGFGVVYRAVCKQSGAVRAAKVLKRARLPSEELQKVENEVALLSKLDHPNILKVYEAYLHDGQYCIITELCEGGTLTSHIRGGRRITEHAMRLIFRRLMGALAYLHELGIVHRDIKLDNILLVHRENGAGSNWDIRLIDFGLARLLPTRRVRDREKVGTYTHVAPEVLRGVYSAKCDLWSAGIALCCLATGSNPFKKATKQHTYESIMKTNIKFEGPAWRNVSMDLKNLLMRLLTKDLGQRISAEGALAHPFLRETREIQFEEEKKDFQRVQKKLTAYYGNNLVSLIESYLSYTALTASDLQQLSSLFQALDLNGDGFIQRQELQATFLKFGCPLAEGELQYVLGKVDKNKSGRIDYSQFVAALTDRSKLFTESSLASAFRYFDANSNGFLEKDELREALKLAEGRQLDFLLGELDKNRDHKISQEEFVRYLSWQQDN